MLRSNIKSIVLNDVSVELTNKQGKKTVLSNINLNLEASDSLIALVGPNGAGKTILIKTIIGLYPHTGQINYICNEKFSANQKLDIQKHFDMVFQNPVFLNRNLNDNLSFYFKRCFSNYNKIVDLALDLTNLSDKKFDNVNGLSGGETKRLAFIRSALMKGDWLILDEVFANLDPNSSRVIEDIILKLTKNELIDYDIPKKTCLFIAHGKHYLNKLAKRVIFVSAGKVEFIGTKNKFLESDNSNVRAYIKYL